MLQERERGLSATCHVHWLWFTLSLWVPAEGYRAFGVVVWGPARLPPPQPQHSHLVIQQLLSHLDANSRSAATVRAGIVEVLSEAAVIAATGSVGKGGPGAKGKGRGSGEEGGVRGAGVGFRTN